jgi:hypothetical protein
MLATYPDMKQNESKTGVIGLRLTPSQLRLIWPGLNTLVNSLLTRQETGSSIYSYNFRLHPLEDRPRSGQNPGTFGQTIMQDVVELWKKFKGNDRKRLRVRMTFVDLSACIFAVRIGREYERLVQGTKHKLRENLETKTVIARLERQLKRARRAYAAEVGESAYKEMRAGWFAHLRWMRMHLAHFRPQRIKTQPRLLQRMIVDQTCESAKTGILKRRYEPPPENELRRLVRLYLRYVRRERRAVTIGMLMNRPRLAEELLSNFVLDREDLNPRTTETKETK